MLLRGFIFLTLPLHLGLSLPAPATGQQQASASDNVKRKPASVNVFKAAGLPQFPSELYAKLSEATRPQWRQHYRATVTRCLGSRPQAAMGLGAVNADLFLAAQARDTQQIRNLLQDEENIEKTLGLITPMTKLRNEVLGAAEQADWVRLATGIEKLTRRGSRTAAWPCTRTATRRAARPT